jgi:hypothetical protein
MCSMRPFLQTVHTGVTNEAPGYVQILFTRRAHWRTGHKMLPSVLPCMTVSFFRSYFCISNVMATLSADSKLLDCVGMRSPSMKKRTFLRHKSLMRFCSCLGTLEYSQDLPSKTCVDGKLCSWYISFCHLFFRELIEDCEWKGLLLLLFSVVISECPELPR